MKTSPGSRDYSFEYDRNCLPECDKGHCDVCCKPFYEEGESKLYKQSQKA